ncbi:MAG: prolipoprotein diacylglyceryl transferase [Clostridia bacterium]|nr:prolipoprotein diacylglyceryl transferase [Clostridia bacterium]
MTEVKTVSLLGGEITLYGILMILACLLAGAALILLAKKNGIKRSSAAVYCLAAALLGLLLGRLIYCAVRFDRLFYDEMGDFRGFLPFFDFSVGSLNIGGVMLGCILAAPLTAKIQRGKTSGYLDCAVFPGLALFTAERLFEPLAGRGYGVYLYDSPFAFYPFAVQTYMGEYALSVCFIEAVLALALMIALILLKKKRLKSVQFFLCALTLFCTSQIMPESLRHDDVLFIFTFARVTHICYALMLAGAMIAALIQARKRGLTFGRAALEFLLLLLGAGICIGAEFALDKTNLSHTLIYAVMIATLAGMAALVLRRILRKEAVQ